MSMRRFERRRVRSAGAGVVGLDMVRQPAARRPEPLRPPLSRQLRETGYGEYLAATVSSVSAAAECSFLAPNAFCMFLISISARFVMIDTCPVYAVAGVREFADVGRSRLSCVAAADTGTEQQTRLLPALRRVLNFRLLRLLWAEYKVNEACQQRRWGLVPVFHDHVVLVQHLRCPQLVLVVCAGLLATQWMPYVIGFCANRMLLARIDVGLQWLRS